MKTLTLLRKKACQLIILFLFISFLGKAADQDINLGGANPAFPIPVIAGQLMTPVNIGRLNFEGATVFWGFESAPTAVGFVCPAGSAETFTCNGITITLPANSTTTGVLDNLKVNISGTPTTTGSITFSLRLTVNGGGGASEVRQYTIEIRKSLAIAFTLDRSGSMGAISEGTITRWEALKTAVNNFTLKLSLPNFAIAGDKLGLNFFHSTVTQSASVPGMIALNAATSTAVNNALVAESPNGSTAMGPGIQDAKNNKLNNAASARTMLIFTDGEQNAPPMANQNGRDVGGTPINNVYPAQPGGIKIFTIGIGNPSGTYLPTLQNLASQNRGQFLVTSNGNSFTNSSSMLVGDINAQFTQAFASALRENSPQIITSKESNVVGGDNFLLDFPLNSNVEDLLIEIRFNKNLERGFIENAIRNTKIIRDGEDVTKLFTPRLIGNFTSSFILVINFNQERILRSIKSSEALWEVRLMGDNAVTGLKVNATAIADDHLFDYEFEMNTKQPSVGDDVEFTAKLGFNHKDMDDAGIFAFVYRPGGDIGDLLAKNQIRVESQSRDKSSVGVAKYNALLKDESFVKSLLPDEDKIRLVSQGNGIYKGVYKDTKVAGIYQIVYLIRTKSPLGGAIFRVETESMYVQFGEVNYQKSNVKILSLNASSMQVRIQPLTVQGLLVGPAMADAFKFTPASRVERETTLANVLDNQDGSYILTFRGNMKTKGTLSLLGKKLYGGVLGKMDSF